VRQSHTWRSYRASCYRNRRRRLSEASLRWNLDARHRLLERVLPESLLSFLDPHGAIGARHCLVIRGREVGVVRSSRRRSDDDGACQLLSLATRLLNCVGRLLSYATRATDLSH
jgi:hypothetical protein